MNTILAAPNLLKIEKISFRSAVILTREPHRARGVSQHMLEIGCESAVEAG
jgi:hypothetical protein